MSRRLANKAAIITGAASGIGAATAEVFSEEGASVVVADIDESNGRSVVQELFDKGRSAVFYPLDVTDYESWRACMAFTSQTFGKLNVLINNAGISHRKDVSQITIAEWNEIVAVNQTGVFYGIKTAIEEMRRNDEPCAIANASSIDGTVGESDLFAYCATKGAVAMMTKAAALYCGEQGLRIRVNSVHPGYIVTPMARIDAEQKGQTLDEYCADFLTKHPVGHLGDPRDIAYGYVYLASDDARFVTGTQLTIDGGYTAQ